MNKTIMLAAFLLLLFSIPVVLRRDNIKGISISKPSASPSVFSPSPSISPTPSTTPFLNNPSPSDRGQIEFYQYPSAVVISQTSQSLNLKSPDDPGQISSWYQQKINSLRFQSKNFVNTNSNGLVSDKLTAQDGGNFVEVEIEKKPGDSESTIAIEVN